MGLVQNARAWLGLAPEERADPAMSLAEWANTFNPDYTTLSFGGMSYPMVGLNQTLTGHKEELDHTFEGLIQRGYRYNAVVFACMTARQQLFSQATFAYRKRRKGRPGDLFSDASLAVLEHPWPGATTGDLLSLALLHADLAGNAFLVRRPGPRIRLLRPTWVTMVVGSQTDPDVELGDIDAEVIGYVYHPGGVNSNRPPEFLLAEEVAHFKPLPDPQGNFRGISWLTSLIREVMADSAATTHKLKFFENGATPNLVVTLDPNITKAAFEEFTKTVEAKHTGVLNAYRTLYLAGGSTATIAGANMQQMEFAETQSAGELRIASAAGVPPVIAGLHDAMQGSSLNEGNFAAAMRRFSDLTMQGLWRNMCGSLETIVPPPQSDSQLWFDDRDIPALRVDRKDAAEIQFIKAQTIRHFIDGGFKADASIQAVEAEDEGILIGQHTNLFSVQLQAPGSTKMPVGEAPGETPVEGVGGPETPKPGAAKPVGPAGTPSNGKAPAAAKAGRALTELLKEDAHHD
jgi:HK97 family phage portal protein